jgi:nucleoside-diphosphate-sugar epimerase
MSEPRYLVTGALGCIGAWTLYHLVKRQLPMVAYDLSTNHTRLDLILPIAEQRTIHHVQGDLRDFQHVHDTLKTYQITHIIHLAALQVPFCRADPVLGAQVNVTGTVNIFEAARQLGIPHIAYASSIAVYGPAEDYPDDLVPHDARHAPRTLYGVYKVADEGIARIYWQDYQISSIALRPYTVYGVGRDQGLTSDPTKALLAAVKDEEFHINFGGTMQFQWASDVAQQFIDAAGQVSQGAQAFNLGTPLQTVAGFIDILKTFKPNAKITHAENNLPFPSGFDDSALRAFVPQIYETPLADGINQTLQQFEACVAKGLL